jgi:hypothetical protein
MNNPNRTMYKEKLFNNRLFLQARWDSNENKKRYKSLRIWVHDPCTDDRIANRDYYFNSLHI